MLLFPDETPRPERVASPVDTAPSATLTGKTTGTTVPEDTRFSLRLQVRAS